MMTGKQRIKALFTGDPIDRTPIAVGTTCLW